MASYPRHRTTPPKPDFPDFTAVKTSDKWIIPMVSIEAIRCDISGEDDTRDKLANDKRIQIRTDSGAEYDVHMLDLLDDLTRNYDNFEDMTCDKAFAEFFKQWKQSKRN